MASALCAEGQDQGGLQTNISPQRWPAFNPDRLSLLFIAILTLAVAIPLYVWFWDNSRQLWYWITHDRHTHYCHGLDLAMDLRHGNVVGLLHDLNGLRVWGPLHSIVLAPVQLLLGPDYRFAIVPSWLAWCAAALLGFLLARRLAPRAGNTAGLVAALFILLSPAHRAYGTDVMLESLGACLSLLCLYFYVVLVQERETRAGLWLGLGLTALFLHKANYWLLVLLAIVLAHLGSQRTRYLSEFRLVRARWHPWTWLLRQLRHPLTYILLAALGAAAWVLATGGAEFHVAGVDVSVNKPHNLIHAAYCLLFVRFVSWWRSALVRDYWQSLPPAFRQVVGLHGWAVALYFLLPKRLFDFLWFLSPFNTDQHRDSVDLMHGASFYFEGIATDYHVASWSMWLVLALAGLAVLSLASWKRGGAVVLCFLFISAILTFQHPMLKYRFLHSWIAALWVTAGVGLACALLVLARYRHLLQVGSSAAVLTLWAFHGHYLWQPGHAQEGGASLTKLSTLPVAEAYLPMLAASREPTLVANLPIQSLLSWTYQERYQHPSFATNIRKFEAAAPNLPAIFERWLKSTRSDCLVLIDVLPDSPYFTVTIDNRDLAPLRAFLAETKVFHEERDWVTAERVRVTVWRRSPTLAAR